jgi:hypothetical protein
MKVTVTTNIQKVIDDLNAASSDQQLFVPSIE